MPTHLRIREADGSDVLLGADNPLPFSPAGKAAFRTTALLAASASFTSAAQDGAGYRRLTGVVESAQAGTLKVEQSDDNAAWKQVSSIAVAAATPQGYDVVLYERHVRVVYTNGATAQTTFLLTGRLQAI